MKTHKRILNFSNILKIEDIRAKGSECSINLRKIKRSEHLVHKRSLLTNGGNIRSESPYDISYIPKELYPYYPSLFHSSSTIGDYLLAVSSCPPSSNLLYLIIGLRKFLSSDFRPTKEVILSNIPLKLIQLLSFPEYSKECVWCLINITSESKAKGLLEHGIVEALVGIFDTKDEELLDLAVWCLGNIAGDCIDCRDYVLETGILNRLIQLFNNKTSCKNSVWCVTNLCKGRPYPSEIIRNQVLSSVSPLLTSSDHSIVKSACETVFFCTNNSVAEQFKAPWVLTIIEMLNHSNKEISFNALRIIGNLVLKSNEVIEDLINRGLLDIIFEVLEGNNWSESKEALLILSNVCAGPIDRLAEISRHKVIYKVSEYLKAEDFGLKTEAVWVVLNLSSTEETHLEVMAKGVIQGLVAILETQNPDLLSPALEALDFLLATENVKELFEQTGGIDVLERLQKHPNFSIYCQVIKITEKYFGFEESEVLQNSAG